MEKPKRKPLSTLNEALKHIRKLPPEAKTVEEFNSLIRKDEEAEKGQAEHEKKKKIARTPEVGI